MLLSPLAFSFPLCLINCSLKIKEPDASPPTHHTPSLALFCSSFPDQDSVKDLAGATVTTNFLCLSFHLEIMDGAVNMCQLCDGHWAKKLRWKVQLDT